VKTAAAAVTRASPDHQMLGRSDRSNQGNWRRTLRATGPRHAQTLHMFSNCVPCYFVYLIRLDVHLLRNTRDTALTNHLIKYREMLKTGVKAKSKVKLPLCLTKHIVDTHLLLN